MNRNKIEAEAIRKLTSNWDEALMTSYKRTRGMAGLETSINILVI